MARGRGCRYSRPTDWCFRCSWFHRAQARGRHISSPGAAYRPRSSSYTWSKGPTYPNYHPLQKVKHKIRKITISIRYVILSCLYKKIASLDSKKACLQTVCYITLSVPAHAWVLQTLDSEKSPVQFLPPCSGIGWLQDRSRWEVPPPQVFVHVDHAAQSVKPPSIGGFTPPESIISYAYSIHGIFSY